MPGSVGKPICIPEVSPQLAEFVGIMMGDGGMSRYQATITLHRDDDWDYAKFVSAQVKELFGYTPGIRVSTKQAVVRIVISRINIVRFLYSLGLPIGDKIRNHIDIPRWIRKKDFLLHACVRGLVDTDGSVFVHSYLSKGKRYAYKKLSFTSASEPLRQSVKKTLQGLGLQARLGSNNDVRIDSKNDTHRYFEVIGSSNPKHLRRYAS